jgi:hypothetical protein
VYAVVKCLVDKLVLNKVTNLATLKEKGQPRYARYAQNVPQISDTPKAVWSWKSPCKEAGSTLYQHVEQLEHGYPDTNEV